MERKLVSVIIPCYHAAKWLPQCFLSLVKQTIGIERMELIFVDDHSMDDMETWKLLKEMERAYKESVIILRLDENMRQGGARNIGLSYASGEYIGFVDADDWVSETLFEKVYKRAKEDNADIVQFYHKKYVDGVGEVSIPIEMKSDYIEPHNISERKAMLMQEKISYGCWDKLYRRDLICEAGVGFAEHVPYEEPLFVYPLLYYAKRFAILPEQLYFYRQNKQGTMYRELSEDSSIQAHAQVQLAVWNFMKQTMFFENYYDEIEFYFIHSYFYETLYLACLRRLNISYSFYRELFEGLYREARDYMKNPYLENTSSQRRVLSAAKDVKDQASLNSFLSLYFL